LGGLDAQLEPGAAAIGGKDSMSGSFLDLDVPPTLISFAIAPLLAGDILSPEFKEAGHPVYLFTGDGPEEQKAAWERLHKLQEAGKVRAAWAVDQCLAEGVMNMAFGNDIGFEAAAAERDWFASTPGAVIAELSEPSADGVLLGRTTEEPRIVLGADSASIQELLALNDAVLEGVYPTRTESRGEVSAVAFHSETVAAPAVKIARPKALIPVFPGTNCEYDTRRALLDAGAEAEIQVVRNLSAAQVAQSVERFAESLKTAQMVVIPGGFSGGDEPDGSAKFITAFFRNPAVKEQVQALLDQRDGLMLGICNGFQALIKLGLVPYGRILDTDENCPTLSYNVIGRHQSRIVHTRVCSDLSPWLAETAVGEVYTVPISHGEGRFLASEALVKELAAKGQIATQYADLSGAPTMDADFNPNGSVWAVEGITSPDGRVLGKMGHSERVGASLYRNVPGNYEMGLFRSAVKYFKK
ncbi:MAG: phosphoribosylformylglycinamidine synthase subunit PurQ, partial [Oscillospiraceae bacterium]|nr:phosphoribosylformylglycinamidine synthase subunit PurQ [Oscillospiraceae bacterium]